MLLLKLAKFFFRAAANLVDGFFFSNKPFKTDKLAVIYLIVMHFIVIKNMQ